MAALTIIMSAKIFNMPAKIRVLWISDEAAAAHQPQFLEGFGGFSLEFARGGDEALRRLRTSRADVVLANFPIAHWTPGDLLEAVQRVDSTLPVILHDPDGAMADAVRLAKLGAVDYFTTPLDAADLDRRLQEAFPGQPGPDPLPASSPWKRLLVGESRAMQDVERIVSLVGCKRCTVLITGETGTGKEMVARALHLASPRAALPMVAVNCSALPENLLEAELFGHVKGAFTGAVSQRVGRFEQAHGSTLFLDEIGDMPLDLQAKLLRVLQEREFQRLGSSETLRVDVRVVAASNVDLTELVGQRRFREDLYYRLNVVPIPVPPLRERLSDIPALVLHFIDKICGLEQIAAKRPAPAALERLATYAWPGNVRQLENAVEMALVLSGDRSLLYPSDFPLPSRFACPASADSAWPVIPVPDDGLDFEQTVSHIEREILEQALRKTGGNKKMAAAMLRLKRTTLSAKLRSLEAAG